MGYLLEIRKASVGFFFKCTIRALLVFRTFPHRSISLESPNCSEILISQNNRNRIINLYQDRTRKDITDNSGHSPNVGKDKLSHQRNTDHSYELERRAALRDSNVGTVDVDEEEEEEGRDFREIKENPVDNLKHIDTFGF
jgi:hypothetical protein